MCLIKDEQEKALCVRFNHCGNMYLCNSIFDLNFNILTSQHIDAELLFY